MLNSNSYKQTVLLAASRRKNSYNYKRKLSNHLKLTQKETKKKRLGVIEPTPSPVI